MSEAIKNLFDDDKPLPRARKKAQKITQPNKPLLDALKFIATVQNKKDDVRYTHCIITNKKIIATNEEITLCVPIEEEFNACLPTNLFIDALSKCEGEFSITSDGQNVTLVSGDYTAVIAGIDASAVILPDLNANIAHISNAVSEALAAVWPVAGNSIDYVLLQGNTAVATNRHMLIEYWHGVDLPPSLCLSINSAKLIGKVKKELTGFGYSDKSITLYYEDGSILQTKRINAEFPSYYSEKLAPPSNNFVDVPGNFYSAIKAIAPFAPDEIIKFNKDVMLSYANPATFHNVDNLPDDMAFNYNYLLKLSIVLQSGKMQFGNNCLYGVSDNARCALMAISLDNKPNRLHEVDNDE